MSLLLILAGCATPALQSSAQAAGGSPAPSPSPTSIDGIARKEAVDVARDALREAGEAWDVVLAEAGPLGQVMPGWKEHEWSHGLSADMPVWRVVMAAGELSGEVVIDFTDGSVYASVIGIAN